MSIISLALRQNSQALKYVRTDDWNYKNIAMYAVERYSSGEALEHVPTDYADYSAIAEVAVRRDVHALKYATVWLHRSRTTTTRLKFTTIFHDYLKIAELAVERNGWALQYVPTEYDYFGELAKIAVHGAAKRRRAAVCAQGPRRLR